MNLWFGFKSVFWAWWPKKTDSIKSDSWTLHNDFLMKTFFPKFRNTGDAQGLLEDIRQEIAKIDDKDCVYEKSSDIKDLRRALEILSEE